MSKTNKYFKNKNSQNIIIDEKKQGDNTHVLTRV